MKLIVIEEKNRADREFREGSATKEGGGQYKQYILQKGAPPALCIHPTMMI